MQQQSMFVSDASSTATSEKLQNAADFYPYTIDLCRDI
ncbi:MAG: hypothetical protein CLLPBCKN_002623 [Chroococcidiopsis cubana SAG 39.79]|nr:hypothetical protein [Chroococcidiopsis cubana SAG 39.79]